MAYEDLYFDVNVDIRVDIHFLAHVSRDKRTASE